MTYNLFMKLVIVGGHLTPALAVIQALPKDTEVVYIGRKYAMEGDAALSLEYQTITAMGIPFVNITAARLQRAFTRHTLPSLTKMPRGMMQAFRILKKTKPDAILSFGGYLSVPVCFAGYLLKIPIIIHEQTQGAGMANKIVSFFATKVCISFPSSGKFFPKEKTVLTGNPILKATPTKVAEAYKKQNERLSLLLITGGSQGSHAMNVLVQAILPELLTKFQIIHQTGDAKEFHDFATLEDMRKGLSLDLRRRYTITKFIDPNDIQSLYQNADLVISRAGINTVLSLLLLQKPAFLIPLPHGQRNEQLNNAKLFKQSGLGEYMIQNFITPEKLLAEIVKMDENRGHYKNNTGDALRQLHAHAAEHIIALLPHAKKN